MNERKKELICKSHEVVELMAKVFSDNSEGLSGAEHFLFTVGILQSFLIGFIYTMIDGNFETKLSALEAILNDTKEFFIRDYGDKKLN